MAIRNLAAGHSGELYFGRIRKGLRICPNSSRRPAGLFLCLPEAAPTTYRRLTQFRREICHFFRERRLVTGFFLWYNGQKAAPAFTAISLGMGGFLPGAFGGPP